MSNPVPTGNLPTAIEQKLRAVRRRQFVLLTTRGLAIGFGALLMGMIIAMTIDWSFVIFSPAARLALTLVTIAIAAGVTALALLNPLRNASTFKQIARLIDASVPSLQQRWTTVTNLASTHQATATARSESMLEQVTSEAVAMHRLVRPQLVAPFAIVQRSLIALTVCVLFMIGWLGIHPQQTSVLWKRFWSPTENITATQLVCETEQQFIPRGETVQLAVRSAGLPRSAAELILHYPSGLQERHAVSPSPDDQHRFMHTVRADNSFRFRMRAGDGQTQWHELQVIDYPEIGEVLLEVIAPDYVHRPPVTKDFLPRRIKVILGTELRLAIKPKQPVKRMTLTVSQPDFDSPTEADTSLLIVAPELHELVAGVDGWYRFERTLDRDLVIEPTMWSDHGLQNETKMACRIETIVDSAPVARVTRPTEEMAVANDEVIDIEFEAHDDHGIATAELVVYDDSQIGEDGRPKVIAIQQIPLGNQRLKKHIIGATKLDLKQLGLTKESRISYAIRVTDNRDSEPMLASPDLKANPDLPASPDIPARPDINEQSSGEERLAGEQSKNLITGQETATAQPEPQILDHDGKIASSFPADERAKVPELAELETEKKMTLTDEATLNDKSDQQLAQNDTPATRPHSLSPEDRSEASQGVDRDATGKNAERDEERKEGVREQQEVTVAVAESAENEQMKPAANDKKKNANLLPVGSRRDAIDADGQMVAAPTTKSKHGGQNSETTRRRLRITERLTAIAASDDLKPTEDNMRERVVAIDDELAKFETRLKALVNHEIPDSARSEQCEKLDAEIGTLETVIADLRTETKDNEFAFVGLQMVDVARFHITPARERIFAAIRRPSASDLDAKASLGHISRGRHQLAKLLKRYDEVQQDKDLKESLTETATMYEVYVEKQHQLMREARQNRNPLARRMAIIEVDQDYLDRFAEVLKLRRTMMEEFGRMLGDDPRLLSRYMDLIRRRNVSMRERLTHLAERQDEAAVELSGWIEIAADQKNDLWTILAEQRLHAAEQLSNDVADLAERIERQIPLAVDPKQGTPAEILRRARELIELVTTVAADRDTLLANSAGDEIEAVKLRSEQLIAAIEFMEALLDQLLAENEGDEEISDYVQPRLLECRTVSNQAEAWAITVRDIGKQAYSSIAATEQHRLAIDTQQLRTEMLNIQSELSEQFTRQTKSAIPAEVLEFVQRLHWIMESITMNQIAAVSAIEKRDLLQAAKQQQLALQRFAEAETVLDEMRRTAVETLDAYKVDNPNIAELVDPTLDEFLARLEREPSIADELGIPERPRNLRIIADAMLWQQQGPSLLNGSGKAAGARASQAAKVKRGGDQRNENPLEQKDTPESEEERERMVAAKRQQMELEKSLVKIEEKADAEETPASEKDRLEKLATSLREVLESEPGSASREAALQQIAESEKADDTLGSVARGETIRDDQWNKLLSTLEDGLWQVRGKKPPAEYRKAIQQYQDTLRELVGADDGV